MCFKFKMIIVSSRHQFVIFFFSLSYANLSCSNARLDPEILPTSVDFPTAIALVLESEERINATQIV
jgi:hypothetical protein